MRKSAQLLAGEDSDDGVGSEDSLPDLCDGSSLLQAAPGTSGNPPEPTPRKVADEVVAEPVAPRADAAATSGGTVREEAAERGLAGAAAAGIGQAIAEVVAPEVLRPVPKAQAAERRRAPDGMYYTKAEFLEFYGRLKEWEAALKRSAGPGAGTSSPSTGSTARPAAAASGGQAGRIWRPNPEVAARHCGVWRYVVGGDSSAEGSAGEGELRIRQTDRGALRVVEEVVQGLKASGLLEPRDKRWLVAEMASKDGTRFGSLRIRFSRKHDALLVGFRAPDWPDWSADTVAYKAIDPRAAEQAAGDLAAALEEAQQAADKGQAQLKGGRVGRAIHLHERALEALQPHESFWQGAGRATLVAAGHGSLVKQLCTLQLQALTSLASCHLRSEAGAEAAEAALACCQRGLQVVEEAGGSAPGSAWAALEGLRGRALAELGRPHEAVAALSRAASLEPAATAVSANDDVAGEERLLAQVQQLRERGNGLVKEGQLSAAAHCYEEALMRLWGKPGLSDEEAGERIAAAQEGGFARLLRSAERAVLTNLALCYLQGEPPELPAQPEKAVGLCTLALDFEPDCTKALLRKAKGLSDLGRHDEAEIELAHAARLAPQDTAVRKELARVRTLAEEARKQARAWEKEAYRDLFDKLPPGFATPAPVKACAGWPAEIFPAPLLELGREDTAAFAEQLAGILEQDGEAAYTMELLHILRCCVELQFGAGAGRQLFRIVPLVQRMTSGSGARQTYEIGKGQRSIASYLHGLRPEQPLHDLADHPRCAQLAARAAPLLAELQAEGSPELWEIPWTPEGGAPRWRAISLVKQGVWVVANAFRQSRILLAELEGLRPYEVAFVKVPAKTMMRHGANANFVLTSHLVLALEDSSSTSLCVGEAQSAWRAGEVVVFDPTYVHFAANNSDSDCYLFVCHFYHPGVTEVERYSLLLLAAIMDCLQSAYSEMFSRASMAPAAGAEVLRALKYAG